MQSSTTHHVITASTLLNGGFTLGTLLGVGVNPVCSLRVIFTLLGPHAEVVTADRLVSRSRAAETESVTALTGDRYPPSAVSLDREGAARGRTPLHQLVLLYERLSGEVLEAPDYLAEQTDS